MKQKPFESLYLCPVFDIKQRGFQSSNIFKIRIIEILLTNKGFLSTYIIKTMSATSKQSLYSDSAALKHIKTSQKK